MPVNLRWRFEDFEWLALDLTLDLDLVVAFHLRRRPAFVVQVCIMRMLCLQPQLLQVSRGGRLQQLHLLPLEIRHIAYVQVFVVHIIELVLHDMPSRHEAILGDVLLYSLVIMEGGLVVLFVHALRNFLLRHVRIGRVARMRPFPALYMVLSVQNSLGIFLQLQPAAGVLTWPEILRPLFGMVLLSESLELLLLFDGGVEQLRLAHVSRVYRMRASVLS